MLLRQLTLKNFRNFKNASIEFSCDPDKKFTIILGQNTFGKTTFVRSFVWGLYGINLFDNKIILNSDVQSCMKIGDEAVAEVIIELDHNGYTYKIVTKETYFRSQSGSITVSHKAYTSVMKIDGVNCINVPQSQVSEEIEGILRSDLRDYFFFEGEKNSIDNITKNRNLKAAVSNILGLNNIEELRDFYNPKYKNSVTSYLENELITVDDDIIDSLPDKKLRAQEKKNQLEEKKKNANQEINNILDQKAEQEAILDANKGIEELQNKKKSLVNSLEKDGQNKVKFFNNLISVTNSSDTLLKLLFAKNFSKYKMSDLREKSSFKSENSYKNISEDAVDDLIKKHRCICGAIIENGNDAYQHLVEAKKHMEPNDYGQYISDFISGEQNNAMYAESSLSNIIEQARITLELIEKIDKDENSLKDIKDQIEGKPDVGSIQRQIDDYNRQLGTQQGIIKTIDETSMPDIDKTIDDLTNQIASSTIDNEKNDFTKECLAYATRIYELANKKIEKAKEEIRTKLEYEVDEIFQSMYHGNRKIRIDDEFKVESTVVEGNGTSKKIDASQGLQTVINYSFVTGLMRLAKENILNDIDTDINDEDEKTEVYPLVMDAPFSATDGKHIKNICKVLPKYCNQIIMFVMNDHYQSAKEVIIDQVGKKYTLNKLSETDCEVLEDL